MLDLSHIAIDQIVSVGKFTSGKSCFIDRFLTVFKTSLWIKQFGISARSVAIGKVIYREMRRYVAVKLPVKNHNGDSAKNAGHKQRAGYVPRVKAHWSLPVIGVDTSSQRYR